MRTMTLELPDEVYEEILRTAREISCRRHKWRRRV